MTEPMKKALLADDREQLAALLTAMTPNEGAAALAELPPPYHAEVYRALPPEFACELFCGLPADVRSALTAELNEKEQTLQAQYLVEQRHFSVLREWLTGNTAPDVALLLGKMPSAMLPLLYRLLPKSLAAEVFVEMDGDNQQLLIKAFSDKELKDVVDELYLDDTVDIIEEMPATVVRRILRQADAETRHWVNEILKYPKDSVGGLMTIEYICLKEEQTVAQAFERIRRDGVDKETIYTCYVTDTNRHLLGYVTVKSLLLADQSARIGDIMDPHVLYVSTLDDKDEAVKMITRYDFLALPVVDGEQRLVGIVTVDDAMDVMEDETAENMEKMAAITPSERPYLKSGVFGIWLQRIPWLMLLMISATFTGAIISSFENSLAAIPVLTAFIPMLMDTGGNAGSQSSVTVIRGMAVGELAPRNIVSVLWKEMRVAVLCGLSLAAAGFAKIWLIDNMLLHNNVNLTTAAVVCITLALTVFVSKLVGCSLPMLAKRLGFDPAVMASPFITTVVDAISLVIYFNMATLFLDL